MGPAAREGTGIGRGRMRLIILAAALPLAALHLPFFMHVAGDAQIHLVTAERFLEGKPFSFDDQLGTVVATTSPFWTLLLIGLRAGFGAFSPLALKLVALSIHAATAWGLYRLARDHMRMEISVRTALLLAWLTSVPIIANALGGLENILCALQLLLIVLVACRSHSRGWGIGTDVQLGLLLGWSWLTRPDGGALALIAVLGAQASRLAGSRRERLLDVARSIAMNVALALIILAPWYAWQIAETGSLLADSSLSRFYAGRRLSWELIPGWLYLNPIPGLTLLIGFLPLTIGCAVAAWDRLLQLQPTGHEADDARADSRLTCIAFSLLVAGTAFYSFVVGGEHFGRYFLPVFPFLFLLGFKGLEIIAGRMRPGLVSGRLLIVGLALCYLLSVSWADFYRRVILKQHFAFNLRETIEAPGRRRHFTDSLLAGLGLGPGDSARLAATEVQIRYFADSRITVLSLDGRTSAAILDHMDPRTGLPDFAGYFEEARPDFVDVGQWRSDGGWGSWLTPRRHHENLVGTWKERIAAMKPGDSFDWKDRKVTYIRDDVVRIDW